VSGKVSGKKSGKTNDGAGPHKTRVTWHDSCHIGRASGVYEPPRELIRANPNAELVEMPFNRAEAHCCGSVLTLLNDPAAAADIGEVRLREAQEVGAETILALCPCCQFPAPGERPGQGHRHRRRRSGSLQRRGPGL